jgi:hypothetical protein
LRCRRPAAWSRLCSNYFCRCFDRVGGLLLTWWSRRRIRVPSGQAVDCVLQVERLKSGKRNASASSVSNDPWVPETMIGTRRSPRIDFSPTFARNVVVQQTKSPHQHSRWPSIRARRKLFFFLVTGQENTFWSFMHSCRCVCEKGREQGRERAREGEGRGIENSCASGPTVGCGCLGAADPEGHAGRSQPPWPGED